MASPLQGMEYKVIKKYPDKSMIIQPVSKFDADDFARLVYVVDGQLLGRPVTVDLQAGQAGLEEAIQEIERLNGIRE